MQIYSATDAKREFGKILVKSQREPVSVTRNGKPIAVILSEKDCQQLKLQALRAALAEGEASADTGPLDMDEIKRKARLKASMKQDAENSQAGTR
ncbi:MAG: type II toxin-antitoxin system Phd/YefM family antitoxin [Porticoccaceae bacterium]